MSEEKKVLGYRVTLNGNRVHRWTPKVTGLNIDTCRAYAYRCAADYPLSRVVRIVAKPKAKSDAVGERPVAASVPVRGPWRVGSKLGRTIYLNDAVVGMVDNAEIAKAIVDAMNGARAADDAIREQCAKVTDNLATLMDMGAGEGPSLTARLRQASRYIRRGYPVVDLSPHAAGAASNANPYEPDRDKQCPVVKRDGDMVAKCNKTRDHAGAHERVSYTGITIESWEDEPPRHAVDAAASLSGGRKA
jgi:hypothetical protein